MARAKRPAKPRQVELPTELITSLFERGAPLLYPTDEACLAAVARGDKASFTTHFDSADQQHLDELLRAARNHGLVASERLVVLHDRELREVCVTRPGEAWRAELMALYWEARCFGASATLEYLKSRALGYTHEQASQWVEMTLHRTPRVGVPSLYLLLPFAAARAISAADGALPRIVDFPICFAGEYDLVLRRDALELLPSGFSIGRAAISRDALYQVIAYVSNCRA